MKSEHKSILDITHGLAAVRKMEGLNEIEVLHFCGYFEKPSAADYEALTRELVEDPEFGLVGKKFELIEAPQDLIDQVKRDYESNISGS